MPWPSRSSSTVTRERPSPTASTLPRPTGRTGPSIAEREAARRVVLGDLVRRGHRAPADAARLERAGADVRRAVRLDANRLELVLPLGVAGGNGEVREDVLLAPRDLDALRDRSHPALLVRRAPILARRRLATQASEEVDGRDPPGVVDTVSTEDEVGIGGRELVERGELARVQLLV